MEDEFDSVIDSIRAAVPTLRDHAGGEWRWFMRVQIGLEVNINLESIIHLFFMHFNT